MEQITPASLNRVPRRSKRSEGSQTISSTQGHNRYKFISETTFISHADRTESGTDMEAVGAGVNARLTVRRSENRSVPQHPHKRSVLPSCSFLVSGSDSCPSGLNRAHTVRKKKRPAQHIVRRSLSLSRPLSVGFCQAGQTKDTGNTPHWHRPPQ